MLAARSWRQRAVYVSLFFASSPFAIVSLGHLLA